MGQRGKSSPEVRERAVRLVFEHTGEHDSQWGSVALGKNADLIVIDGDPSWEISDIRNVEIAFRDGLGYDPKALLASVKGRYGLH